MNLSLDRIVLIFLCSRLRPCPQSPGAEASEKLVGVRGEGGSTSGRGGGRRVGRKRREEVDEIAGGREALTGQVFSLDSGQRWAGRIGEAQAHQTPQELRPGQIEVAVNCVMGQDEALETCCKLTFAHSVVIARYLKVSVCLLFATERLKTFPGRL